MTKATDHSPFVNNPPSTHRLLLTVLAAMLLAGVVLVTIVLPAEYSIDPTGIGHRLGLVRGSDASAKMIALVDNLGGNGKIVQGETNQDAHQPLPLPNPAVYQGQEAAPVSETMTIHLPAYSQTEIKAALKTSKVILYSWKAEGGSVYVDFHGHDPEWTNKEAFVRYEEKKGATGGSGSLVAPFAGEHGWYWFNTSTTPVVITLSVQGYYDKLIDYGVSK
jgi:hypothetical protein